MSTSNTSPLRDESQLTQAQIDASYERHCVPTNPYAPSRKYWGRAMQSGFDLAHASPPSQPIASDVVAAPEPVAWFQNDAAEGQPPHYSQIAAEYVGTEGTFPLFRGSRRSSVEDESHQSPRDTQRLLEALKSLTEKGYTQASGLSWNKRLKAARDLIKEFEQ